MTACAVAMTSSSESPSSTTDFLFVFKYANRLLGVIARVGLPVCRLSILTTSAPKSASSFPQYSPATDSASSTIRMPLSADMGRPCGSRLLAARAAQSPLRREIHVVVLHDVVEALLEGAVGEVDVLGLVVLNQRKHALDHAGEQAAEVFALVLLIEFEKGLLHSDGVGWTRLRACERVLLGLLLERLARHHAVDEAAFVHLLGAEWPSGEEHFGELPQTHRLGPPPEPRTPPDVAESRMAE